MIHAGHIETSTKLQAIMKVLQDGKWYSAREIRELSGGAVEAVSARIQELTSPVNNINIKCKYIDGQYRYRLIKHGAEKRAEEQGEKKPIRHPASISLTPMLAPVAYHEGRLLF